MNILIWSNYCASHSTRMIKFENRLNTCWRLCSWVPFTFEQGEEEEIFDRRTNLTAFDALRTYSKYCFETPSIVKNEIFSRTFFSNSKNLAKQNSTFFQHFFASVFISRFLQLQRGIISNRAKRNFFPSYVNRNFLIN